MSAKQVIGDPVIISGRTLSLSRAVRAGDYVFLTGQVWLREREDFPGFNTVYARYFPVDPPARSAVLNQLLVDVRVEVEVIAYKPVNS